MSKSGHIFRSGPLFIDLQAQTITRNGAPILLRRKAFQVLRILVLHPSRVVSKTELLKQAWGEAVSEDVLSGCIREIRKALDDNARNPHLIRTVHGDGYQFIGPLEVCHEAPEPVAPARLSRKWWIVLGIVIVAAVGIGALLFTRRNEPGTGVEKHVIPKEVAWWRFDEATGSAVLDSSGNSNDGQLQGGLRRVAGVLGTALEFDGKTGYVVGNGPGNHLPTGAGERTVSCWIRAAGPQPGDRNLFHWGTSVSQPPRLNFHLFLRNGVLAWGNGYGQGIILSDASVADGAWHHVGAIYDGPRRQSAHIILDGVQVGETTVPLAADTRPAMPWKIGTFILGGRPFEGLIDDMRVYSSALSASWIGALRNCGNPDLRLRTPLGDVWFVPVEQSDLRIGKGGRVESGKDPFGMAQFARAGSVCQTGEFRGMAMPSTYGVAMTVQLSHTTSDAPDAAGPVVLAQPAGPGDPPGPGYWIALSADATLSIRRLNAREKAVASRPIANFDPSREHRLAVSVQGARVHASVDGRGVLNWQAGEVPGHTAGIAFSSVVTPTETASQRAFDIVITAN